MKKLALFILAASLAVAQSVNVQKTSGTNALTGSLVVGDGKTLTATGTGAIVATSAASVSGNVTVGAGNTFTLNGAATGTPTGGTLSLSALTLTLGTPQQLDLANAENISPVAFDAQFGSGFVAALQITESTPGSFVFNGAPLGTPASATLTNATGLPIATGVSGLGTGVATFLATPSSTNLAAAVTGETGSGALVFATSPTLTTPVLGAATATSITGTSGLTLAGSSDGASLVLGSGTSGIPYLSAAPNGSGGRFGTEANTATSWELRRAAATVGGFYSGSSLFSFFGGATPANQVSVTSTGNLLIGTTTDMSGVTGGVKIASTAASTNSTTGALQVAGGIGVAGASVFGGAVTMNSAYTDDTLSNFLTGNTSSYATTLGHYVKTAEVRSGTVLKSNGSIHNNFASGSFGWYVGQGVGDTAYDTYTPLLAVTASNVNISGTTSASSSTVGALTIGNGTAATNVAIGGGNIAAGANVHALGNINVGPQGSDFSAGRINLLVASDTVPGLNLGGTNYGFGILEKTDGNLYFSRRNGSSTNTTWMSVARASGDVSITPTTASTGVGTGALQVAGGIYAGAASVFGGNIAVFGNSSSFGDYSTNNYLRIGAQSAAISGIKLRPTASDVGAYGFTLQYNGATSDFSILRHEFSEAGTAALTIARATGAATFAGAVSVSGTTATWTSGTGSPESVKTAPVGSLYTRTDGGASTTLYVKESGSGNTGWVAK